jgi:hypothetical protein
MKNRDHRPENIRWQLDRTNWLREVPLAFGEIDSSREDHAPHRVMVRLDGSGPSCSCEANTACTIEKHGEACARAFWAAWAREQDGDTLIREGRELAYAATFWGIDPWQRMKMDAIGDEIGFRMAFTEAA